MTFALVAAAEAAVPLTPVAPESLPEALARLSESERRWVAGLGFKGDPGALALIPGSGGALGRVLVGTKPDEPIWALGGLSEALPAGSYSLDGRPGPAAATRMALGWAL